MPRTKPLAELNSFSLQTDLSEEIVELTHFAVGMIHFAARDLERAITHFTEAINLVNEPEFLGRFTNPGSKSYALLLDPNYIYFFRGLAYSMQNESDLAIADFDEIIGRNPELDKTMAFSTNLGKVYINRAIALLDENDPEAAIVDLEKALVLDPESDLAYYYRGIAHEQQGELEIAIGDYSKVIELSDDKCAHIQRGNAYKTQGDLDAALADFSEAVENNPDFDLGYVNIGIIYRDEGNFDAATSEFEKALQVNPESAFAHYYLGLASKENGDIDSAISHYSRVIEIDPSFSNIYQERAKIYEEQDEPRRAIDDYIHSLLYSNYGVYASSKIIELCIDSDSCQYANDALNAVVFSSSENGWPYYARGKLRMEEENYSSAVNDFTTAIEIDPTQRSWLEARADAYEEMGETELALEDYLALINRENSNSYYRSKLVRVCKDVDLCRQAAIELTKMILDRPDRLELILARAQIYQTYDVDKALKDYDRAEKLDTTNAEIYKLRAGAREKADDLEGALNDYLTALLLDERDLWISSHITNICEKMGNCEDVIVRLSGVIQSTDATASLIFTRGRVYEILGNNGHAVNDYTRIIEFDGEVGLYSVYERRAAVYENMDNLDLAIEDYTTLITDYNSSTALYHRGLLYEQQGKNDLAVADLRAYLEKNPSSYRKEEIEEIIERLK